MNEWMAGLHCNITTQNVRRIDRSIGHYCSSAAADHAAADHAAAALLCDEDEDGGQGGF